MKIIEQPAANKYRFRYESEGSGRGGLVGNVINTFPAIKIEGYKGPARVIVSCVEHEPLPNTEKYGIHPHKLGTFCFAKVLAFDKK